MTDTPKIIPRCKIEPNTFVEFTGLVTPCCWIITSLERYERLKQFMGADFDLLYMTNSPDVIAQAYKKIEDSWVTEQPFETCREICGKKQG